MKNQKTALVFDLDETVVNSQHRTPCFPDGTLNLEQYIAKHTRENVFLDTLLPLARTMQNAINSGYTVAILTARDMAQADYDFLSLHGIKPKHIYSRDKCKTKKHYQMRDGEYKVAWLQKIAKKVTSKHVIMFDDSKVVKKAMRQAGIVCICAHKVNKRLALQTLLKCFLF